MTWPRMFVGLTAGLLIAAPLANAHELECVKTVNDTTFLELDSYPATLTYRLTVRNIHPTSSSVVLEATDPLLEGLGFTPFDTPFVLALGASRTEQIILDVQTFEACEALAAADGTADLDVENVFTVRWDSGTDVCPAVVRCMRPGENGNGGPPPAVEGRMTGGGSVFGQGQNRVTHGFQLRCDADDPRQNLQVNWQGNRFHLLDLTSADCQDTALDEGQPPAGFDTFIGTGTGRYNGQEGATIEFTFTDAGEPGVNDRARIVIRDAAGNVVLSVDGNLRFGNHQAHP